MSSFQSVMFVVLAIWIALFIYLWRLDSRVKEMERRLSRQPAPDSEDAPEAVIEARPRQAPGERA